MPMLAGFMPRPASLPGDQDFRGFGVVRPTDYRRPPGPQPMDPTVPGDWYGPILTHTGPFCPRLDVRLAHLVPTAVTPTVPSIRPSHTVRSVTGVYVGGCDRSISRSRSPEVPLGHCDGLSYRLSTCGRRGCLT